MPQQSVSHQELHPHRGNWLREIIFGLNDGLVTTLVFLMTVSALTQARTIVLIALGEVAAGGISMALGGYLSARTEHEVLDQRIATERWEIVHEPEEERAEVRDIYRHKGLRGDLLERVVKELTADEERWLRTMVQDEHGLVEGAPPRPAWQQGGLIGIAFVIGGLVPTLAFLLSLPQPRFWAYGLTALVAVVLGALKARYTSKGVVRSSLEFLTIVTFGTLAGVVIGLLLHVV
ncbi:MAG TPA: VIT1/CCC1 transporter family protein [Ktedonobacteraceae bacterium]|nr:VIT1/CCC1 transporter family protein [Ktedonobacteraceae bacterium]